MSPPSSAAVAPSPPLIRHARNPGPSWGPRFLVWAQRSWPRWIFRPAVKLGAWAGLFLMPGQRRHSRDYLAVVLGRPARLVEVWRHFFAFTDFLMLKLRIGSGAPLHCVMDPLHADVFETLVRSDRPALFGSFHFGGCDLLGYLLGERGRNVSILRLRMGNSEDTRLLGQRYADKVSFLWVNDPANLLFDLKAAIEAGQSLAMKCDRLEFSAKAEPFAFLGADRLFPFTIYHLAVLFQLPVIFCLAIPNTEEDALRIYASPVFESDPARSRADNLRAARSHFQGVLNQLETLVRQHPELWFNFLPLNQVANSQPTA